jgi:hypothetical protein
MLPVKELGCQVDYETGTSVCLLEDNDSAKTLYLILRSRAIASGVTNLTNGLTGFDSDCGVIIIVEPLIGFLVLLLAIAKDCETGAIAFNY